MASSGLRKSIKAEGGIDENTYKRLYPTGAGPPKYYGLPKVHKPGMPLRPIISSIGSVTHATAKELSRIQKPLVGRSPHHVMNNMDFTESIKGIQLQPEECMVSYDVEALFTSVPVESAISIVKKHLEEDRELHQRTALAVKQISCLLEFCLNTTYFTFQGKMYEQVKEAVMGSPIGPIVANLFMEDLETKALDTALSTPKIWKRFVDDTFTIIQKAHKDAFLDHINSIDSNTHFTYEDPKENGSIPFLDMLIIPDDKGRLNTTVYRKPTHTYQYLHWESHHAITCKYTVIGTLYHRARTVCSNPNQLQKEKHLFKSLSKCKYPNWAGNRVKLQSQTPALKKSKKNSNKPAPNSRGPKTHIVVPYHQGLSESFKRTYKNMGLKYI